MAKGLPRSTARGAPANAPVRRQRITLVAHPVTVAGASGVGWGTAVIGDLPEGNILFLGAVGNLRVRKGTAAGVQDTFDGDIALGTAPAASASLSGTGVNVLGSTALGAATAGVSPVVRATGATSVLLDNTDGSLELNVQLLIDDANISADGQIMLVAGVIDVLYSVLLDD